MNSLRRHRAGRRDGLSALRLTPNAHRVLEARYLKRDADSRYIETPEEPFLRVETAVAEAELLHGGGPAELKNWQRRFYDLMMSLRVLPKELGSSATALEELRVGLHKPGDPARYEGLRAVPHPDIAQQRDDSRTGSIDNQVPHRVDATALLHVQAEDAIHSELEDFPKSADLQGKREREDRHRPRSHVELDLAFLIKHVHQYEAEHDEKQGRAGVRHQVPPPEPQVVAPDFAEEQRSENRNDDQQLELGRDEDVESSWDEGGRESQQHNAGHRKCVEPVPLDNGQHKPSQDRQLDGDEQGHVGNAELRQMGLPSP